MEYRSSLGPLPHGDLARILPSTLNTKGDATVGMDNHRDQILIMTDSRIPTTRLIRALPLQPAHLLPTQLEIVDIRVLLDAAGGHAFRQRHESLLQAPT